MGISNRGESSAMHLLRAEITLKQTHAQHLTTILRASDDRQNADHATVTVKKISLMTFFSILKETYLVIKNKGAVRVKS
jgi:hypothetical protein